MGNVGSLVCRASRCREWTRGVHSREELVHHVATDEAKSHVGTDFDRNGLHVSILVRHGLGELEASH